MELLTFLAIIIGTVCLVTWVDFLQSQELKWRKLTVADIAKDPFKE